MIAAIALANRMALVTRNIPDFSDIGLDLIDPFLAGISR
jgi:predicted nucleic acid-binding protein